jgi:exonuclease SbcD
MLKILHISDTHLGRQFPYLKEKGPDYRFLLIRTFERAVNLAQQEKVALFLISGDLFDNNRVYGSTIGRVMNAFQRLEKAGIRTCILPGAHDAFVEDSIYVSIQLPRNVTLFTPKNKQRTFEDLDTTVYGLVSEDNSVDISSLQGFSPSQKSKYQIGMVYCTYENEVKPDNRIATISSNDIAKSGLDYLALGHYHSFRNVSSGNTVACYPGSTEMLDSNQESSGNAVKVILEEGKRAEINTIRIGTKSFESMVIDVSQVNSDGNIQGLIMEKASPNLILEVTLAGERDINFDLDCRRIENNLGDRFYKLLVLDNTSLNLNILKSQDYPERTVIGRFLKIIEEKIENTTNEEEKSAYKKALHLGFSLLQGRLGVTGDN